jgi:threonine synthase
MYAVQSEGCAPVVHAMEKGLDEIQTWIDPETKAYGLNVPHPFAARLILSVLRRSGGGAVAVAEHDIDRSRVLIGRLEGIDMCPEAAAGLTGVRNLVERGQIDPDEDVILLNTASGARYGFPEMESTETTDESN